MHELRKTDGYKKMSLLIATVGLPRSGKSTWARSTEFPIVSPDSIRLALHGTAWNENAEPIVWAIAQYMIRALFFSGHGVVVLDATNISKKRRDQIKEWARKDMFNYFVRFKEFHTSIGVCVERCGNNEKLVAVINSMYDEREPLSEDEAVYLG